MRVARQKVGLCYPQLQLIMTQIWTDQVPYAADNITHENMQNHFVDLEGEAENDLDSIEWCTGA